jgi:hypothetical protein
MIMLEQRGGFLWEHRPDIIPQGMVTNEELSLWSAYYERQAAARKAGAKNG